MLSEKIRKTGKAPKPKQLNSLFVKKKKKKITSKLYNGGKEGYVNR